MIPFATPQQSRALTGLLAVALLSVACSDSKTGGQQEQAKQETAVPQLIAAIQEENRDLLVILAAGDKSKGLRAATQEVEKAMKAAGLKTRMLHDWGGEARVQYYLNQTIPRLRDKGQVWMVLDQRDPMLIDQMTNYLLRDVQIDTLERFGDFRLLRVSNEFSSDTGNQLQLIPVIDGIYTICALGFAPGLDLLFIAAKHGHLQSVERDGSNLNSVLKMPRHNGDKPGVFTAGESGLIGMAFHPEFEKNRKLYLCYTYKLGGADGEKSLRVSEWKMTVDGDPKVDPGSERILFSLFKEKDNHNGGQLAFGPDGYLYIASGDGEESKGIEGRGPAHTLRGKVLRVDINRAADGKQYAIPADNPFVGHDKIPPETWAWGFRNPWRFSFTPDGRILAGDIGENVREEITFVKKGKHHGWPSLEGRHPRKWVLGTEKPEPPLFDYGRDFGMSVIGGYVYEGKKIDWLRGKYVFSDYLSGRIVALEVPADGETKTLERPQVFELGRWPMLFTTFGKDHDGEIYIAEHGRVLRLEAKSSEAGQRPPQKTVITSELDHDAVRALFEQDPQHPKAPSHATTAVTDLGHALYKNACASCHDLGKYGQDGKMHDPGERNVPSTFNVHRQFAQFWDYRVKTLEQAIWPASGKPHGLMKEDRVLERLQEQPDMVAAFRKAFPGQDRPLTQDNVRTAIAAFLRKLTTRSRWDDYLDGKDDALTAEERKGVNTFISLGCTSCHQYRLLGGHTKHKLGLLKQLTGGDTGHYAVSGEEDDKYYFKVPTLLNVEKTAPYYHDGSMPTLDSAIRDMAAIQLRRLLTREEVSSLTVFFKALTGEPPAFLRQ